MKLTGKARKRQRGARGESIPRQKGTAEERRKVTREINEQWRKALRGFKEVDTPIRTGKGRPLKITQHNMGGLKRGAWKLAELLKILQADVHVIGETQIEEEYEYPMDVREMYKVFSTVATKQKAGARNGGTNHGVTVLVRKHRGMVAEQITKTTIEGQSEPCTIPARTVLVKIQSKKEGWTRPVYIHGTYIPPITSEIATEGKETVPGKRETEEEEKGRDEAFLRLQDFWKAVTVASRDGILITVGDWNTHLGQLHVRQKREFMMKNGTNKRARGVIKWMRNKKVEIMNGRGGNANPWTHRMRPTTKAFIMDLAIMSQTDAELHVITSPMRMTEMGGDRRYEGWFEDKTSRGCMSFAHRPVRTIVGMPVGKPFKETANKSRIAPGPYDTHEMGKEEWETFVRLVDEQLKAAEEKDKRECGAVRLTEHLMGVAERALKELGITRKRLRPAGKPKRDKKLEKLLNAACGQEEAQAAMEYLTQVEQQGAEEKMEREHTTKLTGLYEQIKKHVTRTSVPLEMETKEGGTVMGTVAVADLMAKELGAKQQLNLEDKRFDRRKAGKVQEEYNKSERSVSVTQTTELDDDWRKEEVIGALRAIRPNAASNPRGVYSNKMLYKLAASRNFVETIRILWNLIGIEGQVHHLWNEQMLVPIFKNKGTPRRTKYWRPIGLMIALANVYLKACDQRLRRWMFPKVGRQGMSAAQMAFIPGYKTPDASMLMWEAAVWCKNAYVGIK